MYIHPFLAGVLTVVGIELVAFTVLVIITALKNRGGKQ